MARVRVPSFLSKLDEKEKKEMMQLLKPWRASPIAEHLVAYLHSELDQLSKDEEKQIPVSEFQTRWNHSKRLGKRENLRQLIKDLQ